VVSGFAVPWRTLEGVCPDALIPVSRVGLVWVVVSLLLWLV
jgi:hypothetical protein